MPTWTACCAPTGFAYLRAMINANALLSEEFDALKSEILKAYEQSGLMASGNWGESLEVVALPNGISIIADGYADGRPAGKQPPSAAIEKWLVQKGIAARTEKEIATSSLAYLIARKIGRQGWKPKISGSDIIESVATPQRIQQIIDRVGEAHLSNFTESFLTTMNAT